jgi:hypothetical protein
MGNSSKLKSAALIASVWSHDRTALRRLFAGKNGIRAGWSVLLFAAIFWILNSALNAALRRFVSLDVAGPIPFGLGLLEENRF